ncbi:MAG: hypothetical protein ACHQUC_01645 [Chlamydiales bacterium]
MNSLTFAPFDFLQKTAVEHPGTTFAVANFTLWLLYNKITSAADAVFSLRIEGERTKSLLNKIVFFSGLGVANCYLLQKLDVKSPFLTFTGAFAAAALILAVNRKIAERRSLELAVEFNERLNNVIRANDDPQHVEQLTISEYFERLTTSDLRREIERIDAIIHLRTG